MHAKGESRADLAEDRRRGGSGWGARLRGWPASQRCGPDLQGARPRDCAGEGQGARVLERRARGSYWGTLAPAVPVEVMGSRETRMANDNSSMRVRVPGLITPI